MHVDIKLLVSFIWWMIICSKRIDCVPTSSLNELLVRKAHGGGLMGHFGVAKTLDVLHEHFYWQKMKRDVQRICEPLLVERQNLEYNHMDYIHHYMCLLNLG
jgi:hypothetical protein